MTTPDGLHRCAIDHLVVLADSLQAGADWCRRTLGVAPALGGEHPQMGTHNRLLPRSGPLHPRAYLEIIAINPGAKDAAAASAKRWFVMDDEALQAQVRHQGPQLIHWVASVPDLAAARSAMAGAGWIGTTSCRPAAPRRWVRSHQRDHHRQPATAFQCHAAPFTDNS